MILIPYIGRRNYNSIAGEAHWADDGLHRRYATLADVRTACRLGDALPWINIVGAMADPHELSPRDALTMLFSLQDRLKKVR